jgi:hypothetical protein
MKRITFCRISIVFNAVLGAAVLFLWWTPAESLTEATPPVVLAEKQFGRAEKPPEAGFFHWRDVESEDYREYIAKLRKVGCPEETIRDIIVADINKAYARLASESKPANTYRFWHTRQPWEGTREERQWQGQRRKLDEEKRALVKELLGIDLQEEIRQQLGWGDRVDPRHAFLPEEKGVQMRKIEEEFGRAHRASYDQFEGDEHSPAHRAELARLDQWKRAQIEQHLGPSELEQFDLLTSPIASRLRDELVGFEPTEQEFRALYQIEKEFEQNPVRSKESQEQRLRALLGAERFADYQLLQRPDFRDLARFTAKNDLPLSAAKAIDGIRQTTQETVNEIKLDPELPEAARQELLSQIKVETERALVEAMGEKNYKTYRRSSLWIEKITLAQQ